MSFRLPPLWACLIGLGLAHAVAAPYVPVSDATVLERMPYKPTDPIAREMAKMRAELQRDPRNLEVAVRLAQRYYNLVGEEGDPRYLGYAQAVLAPWWELKAPPPEVQLLRASLAQFRHDFSGALADLTQLLERVPQHSQARILRALINIVQARYEPARADCLALRGVASDLIAVGCSALIDGLTGKADAAYRSLSETFKSQSKAADVDRMWALVRLAELAQVLDRRLVAEAHFKEALAIGVSDTFLLAAYADFLLDQKRPAEVVTLLKDKTRSDVLLLRLAFAERALNLPAAKEHEAALAARFTAAQMRGDSVHQQEEARFALTVERDPKKALALAQENWKVQREPRDARIFLEAALAAKEPAAAGSVLQWVENSRIEHPGLIGLAKQLKGAAN